MTWTSYLPSKRSNYQLNEVRALVENYVILRTLIGVTPSRLWVLCVVADLQRAFSRLEPELRRRLFEHGVRAVPFRSAEEPPMTALRRYEAALERLTTCLNGGL